MGNNTPHFFSADFLLVSYVVVASRSIPLRLSLFHATIFLFLLLTFLSKQKAEQRITQLRSYTHYHATLYTFCATNVTGYHTLFTHFPMPLYFFRFRDISLRFRIRWHHSKRCLSSSPLPCTQSRKHISVHNPLIIISDLPFPIIISRVQHSLTTHSPDAMFRFHIAPLYLVPIPLPP